jgi:NAD(P)-dependent dehydrogenase (short-subunit alcohol dehydrogenase family)
MKNSIFDLTGKTAVVVGGTGALGGAMAMSLAQHGAGVALLGRNDQRGASRAAKIQELGAEAVFCRADVSDPDSLEQAKATVLKKFGRINILVNAAGGNRPSATLSPGTELCDLSLEGWHEVFDLNLVGGTLLPTQIFGSGMLQSGQGSIINIASMAGMTPLSRVVAYSAAKAAVINLTQFLAREWATRGVRVNAISPGFFPAEQNKALLYNEDGSYSQRGAQIIDHTPMQRFGESSELGGAVVWLASDRASSFVTGQNIIVDGGFSSTTI